MPGIVDPNLVFSAGGPQQFCGNLCISDGAIARGANFPRKIGTIQTASWNRAVSYVEATDPGSTDPIAAGVKSVANTFNIATCQIWADDFARLTGETGDFSGAGAGVKTIVPVGTFGAKGAKAFGILLSTTQTMTRDDPAGSAFQLYFHSLAMTSWKCDFGDRDIVKVAFDAKAYSDGVNVGELSYFGDQTGGPEGGVIPAAPVSTSTAGTDLATIAWSAVSGATSYSVFMAPDVAGSAGTYIYVMNTLALSAVVPSLTTGDHKWFCVTARNAYGESLPGTGHVCTIG